MMKVKAFYFSATGTTEKIVLALARNLSLIINGSEKVDAYDFTLIENRIDSPEFSKEDLVVVGVPVYAGRVPNVLLNYLSGIEGSGAQTVAVVVYGNRNYDDALIELKDILEHNNFQIVATTAFIGEHAFSKTLAKGRPNVEDLKIVEEFANRILDEKKKVGNATPKGNPNYNSYYKPLDEEGNPVDIRKVKPKTNDKCINCLICVNVCPMGAISKEDVRVLTNICIKCCACIKRCPVGAKFFDDEDYLRHKRELEEQFSENKKPELFV
jgi:ferredoxin/menaquinone-dependent protoporphyrinogen IX oxidase